MKNTRRKTQPHFSAGGKIRIVLGDLHDDETIAALCCKESFLHYLHFIWSKELMKSARRRFPHSRYRYYASLNNVTLADAYFGGAPAIIKERGRIEQHSTDYQRLQRTKPAA